ncbi:LytR/AlgR family response regulator transcription factor [Polaribacter sp. SA4-12]|uniref:LytR/AlgR family response regulator transcription factor n=1 Tax=Polaribacter sp. SA4-12 TaxID=1312072 RepID=UPI000B3BE089|nr:LytTR family transcriptional regulator DNA-binding domain-containing protein [Polaribacter sp. SA4-12]ARV15754.1 hypothetical protein BTO07_11665 [Polaribacter sp. SA4-12]
MFNYIKYFLIKPFKIQPFISNKVQLSVSHGLFIFAFLNLFKPFKLDLLNEYFFGYSILMGIQSIVTPYLIFVILKKVNYKKWNYSNILILCFFCILIYSLVLWYSSGFYKDLKGYKKKLSFTLFYRYTSIISIFSMLLFFVLNDKIIKLKNKIHNIRVEKNNQIIKEKLTIYSEGKKESIVININELIYTSITGNYVSFYINTQEGIKELVLRNTLSNIINQISDYPNFIRCHKSYIINTNYIDSISGNARGYFLKTNQIENLIPVSRKFNKEYLEKIVD